MYLLLQVYGFSLILCAGGCARLAGRNAGRAHTRWVRAPQYVFSKE